MFKNPSLMTRIAIGKTVGLIIGLAAFFLLPQLMPDVSLHLRWGVLLWYITFGAIIGVFGVMTWHPILKFPLPWWFMSPFIGGWLNFALSLVAYDTLEAVMLATFGDNGLMASPFWFALEGAIVGFVIGYLATKYGGEGSALLEDGSGQ